MCVCSDSDTLKIGPLSSPLFSRMEIIAITTVVALLQGASEDNFLKKGLWNSQVLCYESYRSSKNFTFTAGVQGPSVDPKA